MSSVNTVRLLKEDLLKQQARPSGEGRSEKILDILQRLDNVEINLAILSETLIGASVSKLKSHDDANVSSTAKKLVKKWKGVAKKSTSKPAAAATTNSAKKAAPTSGKMKQRTSIGSSSNSQKIDPEAEWQGLPQLRINICKKFHTIFLQSKADLLSKGLNESAVEQLCLARAGEVESSIDAWSKGVKQTYTEKVRGLVFNLKKNGRIREQVIMGQIPSDQLPKMTPEQLATEEKARERDATVKKLQDSRRLDWDQANEGKINDMCGIKGDLLKASLFTCGRCKSTKTTSTQKQTRSADEPMTVFVFCMNCGNRWKC
mmetsp:Transcript_35130/g.74125  ORF Transcript_35130/g.74125 Transcript_35130/m.74125 type:complete len:317 (-) Transcript_35130:128-1078(-)